MGEAPKPPVDPALEIERLKEELRAVKAARDELEELALGGTWTYDLHAMRLIWSPGLCRIHRVDPATHEPSPDMTYIHPDDRPAMMAMAAQAAREGRAGPVEARITTADGTTRVIASSMIVDRNEEGISIGGHGAVLDVTARRELEKMLADAQRTDALGRMAGGIAHDFNNLLSALVLSTAMARRNRMKPEALDDALTCVDGALSRAADLTRQLLAFSRRQPLTPRVMRPDRVIDEMDPILRGLLGPNVSLVIDPGDDEPWYVKMDRTQLEQVILNLVVNARDAMPRGGNLRIELRNVTAGMRDEGATPGKYVSIAVIDDGVGMTEELQERIFDPYFTTKRPGEGTGLGLATCKAIVQQARGRLELTSAPGHGSRFTVLFPRSVESLTPIGRTMAAPTAGQLNILVIDDDPDVLRGVVSELEWQGHAVWPATSGSEARVVASAFPAGSMHLILCDLLLGAEHGITVAREISVLRPEARVLVMTGYVPEGAAVTLPYPVLAKPFSGAELAAKIDEVLTRSD